jgi:Kef-type K+ transport system membrane component KefB
MNIINSEIGRMALSASMISDACMWIFYFVILNGAKALEKNSYTYVLQLGLTFCYFAVLFYLLRPLIIWVSNRHPKEKAMRESHFIVIICILLFVGLSAQMTGQPAFVVAFWFGLVLPDGPPLGPILAEKLDTIGSTLIVPAYCTTSGLRTGVPTIVGTKSVFVEVILISVYIGKFVGTILPSLYFHIELGDSLALALIMCCKGLMDLCLFNILLNSKVLSRSLNLEYFLRFFY